MVQVVSIIRVIGAYVEEGKNSVFAIPGDDDPARTESAMPYEREDAIRLIGWTDPDTAEIVADSVSKLLRHLDVRVVDVVIPDD